jgi:hypothetical protein
MEAEGIAQSAISAFESTFNSLVSGNTGIIPEDTISPSPDLVKTESIDITSNTELLKETVVLKLNGGLGTGMGLDKAKSLLKVKGNDTFLDLTAKQVMKMREDYGSNVKFMLMNSFSTSEDTLDFFAENYPTLRGEKGLEMIQNKVPKLDATTYEVRKIEFYSRPILNLCTDMLILLYPPSSKHYFLPYLTFNSLQYVKLILLTNGAHQDMVISMLHLLDQDVLIISLLKDTSTCLFPTRITLEQLCVLRFLPTLRKQMHHS